MTVSIDHVDTAAQPQESASPSWFSRANFGMFVHFDQASQLGVDLSWPIVGMTADDGTGAVPRESIDYFEAEHDFDPVDWDPRALAAQAARAGMTYAVFTTRHHSGWTSWPSRTNPAHSIATSPYGRRGGDLVREFTDAFREAGLRVGLYFSVSDWSDPDYPAWSESFAPYTWETYPRGDAAAWDRYLAQTKEQLRELLTDYGTIDLLFFDGGWERTPEEWRSAEFEEMIRELQPEIVVNDRLPGLPGYETPEQAVPAHEIEGNWEANLTMNNTWGWDPSDRAYKSTAFILRTLAECVSAGGNLLLNVGPRGDGSLPEEESRILDEIADWMDVHGEAIVGAGPGLPPHGFYGPTTTAPHAIYLFLASWPHESGVVRGIHPRRVEAVELLTAGIPLEFISGADPAVSRQEDPIGNLTFLVPDRRPTGPLPVVKITYATAEV